MIATLLACLSGLLTLTQPLDQIYWNVRFWFGEHAAPQSVVLVRMDSRQSGATGAQAENAALLLRRVAEQRPRHIYFDGQVDDAHSGLAGTIRELGDRATVVARIRVQSGVSGSVGVAASPDAIPAPSVVAPAQVAVSSWLTNFWGYGTDAAYGLRIGDRYYPALGARLAGRDGSPDQSFRPDFSVSPASVPSIRAGDLLAGRAAPGMVTGRDVIVVEPRTGPGSVVGYFGHGRIDPVFLDIAGAAGLRSGLAINIDWLPLVLAFVGLTVLARRQSSVRIRRILYAGIAVALVAGPVALERLGIYSNPSAAIAACVWFAGHEIWIKWRRRVLQTSASGLPNFLALCSRELPRGHDVIVATISRYEEFLATLPRELHGECARQIARRFAIACGSSEIYHGDGGHFAWVEPARSLEEQVEHLEGMRALFSAPLLVGGQMFDTNVHFGLDRNLDLDITTRINTALSSASEALKHGTMIEQFGASRLANASWELSLLARIDEGMRNGDIWLAYQPQWDYHEGRISGAEALIRWNDPVRGPIRPDEFILQAERAGRIDALTYWVMEQAITAGEQFNAFGVPFQVSVNLSAQLVDKPSLVGSIAEIARRRGIDCRLFTIEVTETASVQNRPAAIANLQQLQAMGFRLSIDDFGTGEASLVYLADLPSDELKLDLRFVSRIVHHERERHIVASTIKLAHALKQTVVAEGIEDLATFDMLRKLGCDVGQGYYIGRPETLSQLLNRYAGTRGKRGVIL